MMKMMMMMKGMGNVHSVYGLLFQNALVRREG